MSRIYFDYNATAPLRPAARDALVGALDAGNASSVHAEGRAARAMVETARVATARALGTRTDQVIFVSGATEAAATALRPREGERLLIGAGEHVCVQSGHSFPAEAVASVRLNPQGRLDLEDLHACLAEAPGARAVLALQAVNNETGVVQPVAEAAAIVHAAGGTLVCDAVQAFSRIPCSFAATGADILFLSSHKLGGPKGAGALAFARRDLMPTPAFIRGGGQERSFRGGTENVAAVAGFAAALQEAEAQREAETMRLVQLRDFLQAGVLEIAPEAAIFGQEAARVANSLAFALPGLAAETMVAAFDVEGVALSSGSACSSGKVAPSHVLAAMGVSPDLARSALRISLGWDSTTEEGVRFLEIFAKVHERMRRRLRS
ncbi:cysteine desulfurase [Rhodoblastus acidophilus]|uniref:Cysteine desulfurase n=1 Tax=Candidatus Rhodoblastus alkanivorans TaxID=2954117 RepID=A0ABS9Z8R7_9HYPH|nr:cysteine desulfurase family protein [Candidatus Rhodoblastus alkanivorans]MCI4679299.1 cysteine desulfurase [Candidatus Rhodoblastus alkanivorans]MCI4684074.1 cysteine desulfurase [Candidatus Rhodoblastus alkanivorans]MDI4641394.1 cysteine desulfurase [Rhodoblastus acidophilus]